METARTVENLRRVLEQMPSVRLAVLFGSTAGGIQRSDSDLDIGVSLQPEADLDAGLGVALERAAGTAIDLVWLDAAPPLLRFRDRTLRPAAAGT